MNYSTRQEGKEAEAGVQEIEALSVYRAFEQVEDGRQKRGVRYSVAHILTLVALGKLAGMTTPAAIAEWVRLRAEWLKQVLAWPRPGFPCASTYSNVLRKLDAEQVNHVLAQFLLRGAASRRCGEEPSRLDLLFFGHRQFSLSLVLGPSPI
jgi:hypothetical protein